MGCLSGLVLPQQGDLTLGLAAVALLTDVLWCGCHVPSLPELSTCKPQLSPMGQKTQQTTNKEHRAGPQAVRLLPRTTQTVACIQAALT